MFLLKTVCLVSFKWFSTDNHHCYLKQECTRSCQIKEFRRKLKPLTSCCSINRMYFHWIIEIYYVYVVEYIKLNLKTIQHIRICLLSRLSWNWQWRSIENSFHDDRSNWTICSLRNFTFAMRQHFSSTCFRVYINIQKIAFPNAMGDLIFCSVYKKQQKQYSHLFEILRLWYGFPVSWNICHMT